jgi:hypothetical protein
MRTRRQGHAGYARTIGAHVEHSDATAGEELSVNEPGWRGAQEHPVPRSAPVAARLARVPRILLILAVTAAFAGGLLLPGWLGALLLTVLVALTAWLASLSWAAQPVPLRAVRLLVIGALAALAASKLL